MVGARKKIAHNRFDLGRVARRRLPVGDVAFFADPTDTGCCVVLSPTVLTISQFPSLANAAVIEVPRSFAAVSTGVLPAQALVRLSVSRVFHAAVFPETGSGTA